MRPIPAQVLLSILTLGAVVGGVFTSQPIFFPVAALAGFLLTTSLSTSRRPLTRALGLLRGHPVQVHLWGAPPPPSSADVFVLASVNIIGAGTHLFFRAPTGTSMHLKIAQPRDPVLAPNRVVIASARYVQWNGVKLKPATETPAVVISLAGSPEGERPGSVA